MRCADGWVRAVLRRGERVSERAESFFDSESFGDDRIEAPRHYYLHGGTERSTQGAGS